MRRFIQRFSQVRNTIPRVAPHAVIVAFRQGVRDERMLEKLGTHKIETTAELFALADKCAKAAEARAWHAPRPVTDQPSSSRSDKREKKRRRKREAAPIEPTQGSTHMARAPAGRRPTPRKDPC